MSFVSISGMYTDAYRYFEKIYYSDYVQLPILFLTYYFHVVRYGVTGVLSKSTKSFASTANKDRFQVLRTHVYDNDATERDTNDARYITYFYTLEGSRYACMRKMPSDIDDVTKQLSMVSSKDLAGRSNILSAELYPSRTDITSILKQYEGPLGEYHALGGKSEFNLKYMLRSDGKPVISIDTQKILTINRDNLQETEYTI